MFKVFETNADDFADEEEGVTEAPDDSPKKKKSTGKRKKSEVSQRSVKDEPDEPKLERKSSMSSVATDLDDEKTTETTTKPTNPNLLTDVYQINVAGNLFSSIAPFCKRGSFGTALGFGTCLKFIFKKYRVSDHVTFASQLMVFSISSLYFFKYFNNKHTPCSRQIFSLSNIYQIYARLYIPRTF
jgi:hypothetical protein